MASIEPVARNSPFDVYPRVLARLARTPLVSGPRLVGIHLEGPALGSAIGAHRPECVAMPDLSWWNALPPIVRIVTIGAEHDTAPAVAELLIHRGVLVSIGHTSATHEQLDRLATAGARMTTHLFNGMSGLHHRQPGVCGVGRAAPDAVAWEADVHTGLWAASRNPARCAGLSDRSVIAEGLLADMVELDDHWQVRGTWVAGQRSG